MLPTTYLYVCAFLLVGLMVVEPAYGMAVDAENKRDAANDVKQKIAALNKELVQHFESHDVDGVVEMLDDQMIYMLEGAPTAIGKENVGQTLSWDKRLKKASITSLLVKSLDADDNYILEIGDSIWLDEDNNAIFDGRNLFLWKKEGDDYKLYINMFNSKVK